MDANEFLRLKTLFNALADLSPDEREARLDAPGLGDTLRQRLRALFEADVAMQTMTARSALRVANMDHDSSRWIGRRIGAFAVERELGQGGMGSVFLAHRVDGGVAQQVAIKIIRPERLDENTLARFRLERQVLAVLQHPNIAALHDVGELDDGTPYVVMEYIDGLPITLFARQQAIGLKESLKLFLKVCDAVSYAHRNMIVHRDLKPRNVLVSADGDPKLLDFGIAKPLLGQLGSIDVEQTADAQRFFSLSNAAPEQVRGEAITTACDVYGLGVLLYELLSGTTPFALEGRTPAQLERDICEVDPPPPSARTSGDESYRIPRDLDLITLRCLRKAPADRYASVDRLAEDLRNYLDDRPVMARRGNVLYLATRFLARNKIAVALSGAVLAAAATGAVAVWRQQQATLEQRVRADNMTDLILSALRSIDPKQSINKNLPAREVFDRVAAHTLVDTRLDPLSQARLLTTIANIDLSLGVPKQSVALLDKIDMEKLPLEERNDLFLAKAQALRNLGQFDDAQQIAEKAKGLSSMPEATARWGLLAAQIDLDQGKLNEAIEQLRPLKDAHVEDGLKDEIRISLAAALHAKGTTNDESLAIYTALLQDQRQRLPANHPALFDTLNGLFVLALHTGKLEDAKRYAAEAETIAETVYGRKSLPYLRALSNRAMLARDGDDNAEGIRLEQEQLEILQNQLGEIHPNVAKKYFNMAGLYNRLGQWDKAEASFRKAIDIGERVWLPSDLNVLIFRSVFASALVDRDQFAAAQEVVRPALRNVDNNPELKEFDVYPFALLIDSIGSYGREPTPAHRDALLTAFNEARAKAEGRSTKEAIREISALLKKMGVPVQD